MKNNMPASGKLTKNHTRICFLAKLLKKVKIFLNEHTVTGSSKARTQKTKVVIFFLRADILEQNKIYYFKQSRRELEGRAINFSCGI